MYLSFIGNVPPEKAAQKVQRVHCLFRPKLRQCGYCREVCTTYSAQFFSHIFIFSYMRLKFKSLSLLDHQKMPKPIPHCSNFLKIIFLKKGPSDNLSTNKYLMSRPHVGLLHWNLSWAFTFIILLTRQGVSYL